MDTLNTLAGLSSSLCEISLQSYKFYEVYLSSVYTARHKK